MGDYKLALSPDAKSELESLVFPMRRQLNHAIVALSREPRPERWEPIGDDTEGRIVLHGMVVLYSIDDGTRTVTIHAVRPV